MEAGTTLGRAIAEAGLRLVYGGGTKGIMGAVAEGTRRAGGKVTGIIPRFLITKEATETALKRLDDLVVTDNMHQRKHIMFEKSDAFVALPGGIGTVEEIVEIMTWGQPAITASRSSSAMSRFLGPDDGDARPYARRGVYPHRPSGEAAAGGKAGSDHPAILTDAAKDSTPTEGEKGVIAKM
jgi:uncharacterized protein (TIGR00725 family)